MEASKKGPAKDRHRKGERGEKVEGGRVRAKGVMGLGRKGSAENISGAMGKHQRTGKGEAF